MHGLTVALLLAALLALTGAGAASAQDLSSNSMGGSMTDGSTATSGATIASDKDDYPPGAHVVLTGAGWKPNEPVNVHVEDDEGKSWSRSVDVTADGDGNLVDEFDLPNWFVATYTVTATGAESGVATTTFTDGNVWVKNSSTTPAGTTATYRVEKFTGSGDCRTAATGTTNYTLTGPGAGAATGVGINGSNQSARISFTGPSGRKLDKWHALAGPASTAGDGTLHTTATSFCVNESQLLGSSTTYVGFTSAATRSTSTALASNRNPSAYGESVTFTATVTSTGGDPSGVGTVTFKNGSTTLCNAVPLASGANTAQCATSALKASSTGHGITAEYSGTTTGTVYTASTSPMVSQVVNPKPLTGSFTAQDKEYDRTATATIVSRSVAGKVGSDDVSLSGGAASFASKTVGPDKTVNGSGFSLAGADKDNYALASSSPTTTASITAKQLTGSFTASDKVYDGNRDASVATKSLPGVVDGDTVTLDVSGAQFDTEDIGSNKDVAGSLRLDGADKGNYALSSATASTKASIAARELAGSFTANDRAYDGTKDATIGSRSLSGVVGTERVTLDGGTAEFGSGDVGSSKTVTGTGFALAGADRGNYVLKSSTLVTEASISAKELTGSFTANDKVYDGDRSASVSGQSLTGVIGTEDVGLSVSETRFDSRDAGTGKDVSAALALTGADKGNYALKSAAATTKAAITAKELTGSFTASDKAYDGNRDATVATKSLPGVIGTDDASLAVGNAQFDSKHAGVDKDVTGDLSIAGAEKGNYTLKSATGATKAGITARELTGAFTAADKVFNGTAAATIRSRSLTGVVGSEDVTLSGGTATFDNANVGQNKPVTGTGFGLDGADKANYSLKSSTLTTTASIAYAATGANCAGGPGRTILQPINADGTSVFKQGSTVPAKFRVCDAQGSSVGTPGVVSSFKLIQTRSGTVTTAPNEDPISTSADSAFRWSSADQLWIFNISTKNLSAGRTYAYRIMLADGTWIDFQFGLR